MNAHAWLVLAAFGALLLAAALPLGRCLVAVMEGRLRFADHIEQPLYRLCGVRPEAEMGWLQYAFALLLFNALGVLAVYALQRLQQWLPLNPQGMANVTPDSAFNTAVSFATNTNWQGYSGEQTMSYLTQMLGLAVQNFLSAATGIVVVIALIRGLARHSAQGIGNAWVDLTRVTLWVLLPLSFVLALSGHHDAWSLFTNLINYLLVGALFLGEFAYRRVRFRNYRHHSPLQLLRNVRRTNLFER